MPAMLSTRTLRQGLALCLLVPALTAVGCKKKVEEPPPLPPEPQKMEVKLQIVSFTPSLANANETFDARVMGSGFKSGASVRIGTTDGGKVRVFDDNTMAVEVPGMPEGSYDITVTNPEGESSTLRGGLTVKSAKCNNATVYFGFDQDGLNGDASGVLQSANACFQSSRAAIQVQGHTCELGTTEYNLALGQRRADSVRSWLTANGVSGSRVTTVSYGEERAADKGHNEAAYQKNRRAEILPAE